jgi:uncharacterized membrane protein YfcA
MTRKETNVSIYRQWQLMISILILIFICSFLAFSLSAVCGGGAGLLLLPALGLYLPIGQVPPALSIGTLSSSASRIIIFFRSIRWAIVKWFVPTAVPAVFLGVWLLHFVNPLYLEIAMGIFLISNLSLLFSRKGSAAASGQESHRLLLIIGFLAGFLSGLTGAVGLLFNRFYLRYGLSKDEIVATRAANELILHIIKLCLYFSFGLLTGKVIGIGCTIAIAGFLSTWFMKWGLKKISEGFFRRVGYASMVISGASMLSQSGNKLFSQNNGYLSFMPITKGIESKVQWQQASFAVEFEYDEGLEYEQQIPFSELPADRQNIVITKKAKADKVIVEEVFGFNSHSYEAYFFRNGSLIDKIDI